jgi:hypothetical protein
VSVSLPVAMTPHPESCALLQFGDDTPTCFCLAPKASYDALSEWRLWQRTALLQEPECSATGGMDMKCKWRYDGPPFRETVGIFTVNKAEAAWSWQLTSINCRSWEWVEFNHGVCKDDFNWPWGRHTAMSRNVFWFSLSVEWRDELACSGGVGNSL